MIRSFHEDQLWPFAESVKAGLGSVMCAYNRVNQTYSCENRRLLNDILKEELDFQVSEHVAGILDALELNLWLWFEGFHAVRLGGSRVVDR